MIKDHVQIYKSLPEAQIRDIYYFCLNQHDFLLCHRRKLNWSDIISIHKASVFFLILLFIYYLFIIYYYLFIYGCVGSSFLHEGFL